jgi:hypothetical protein
MECVRTCAYDNVAVFWRRKGWDKGIASYGEAWQAMVMFALACLYCYINLGAWDRIRNWIDIVDKHHWGTFAAFGLIVWTVCLGVLPLLWYLLTGMGIAAGRWTTPVGVQFRATSAALIPIGLACWMAFALATALSMATFVMQSLSDPFNWGWNLLGMAGSRWHIIWSPAIPWLEVGCVLVGARFSLKTLYERWMGDAAPARRSALASVPQAAFLWIATAGMIWFFAG